MALGALVDLGLPVEELQGLLADLGLADVSLTARQVTKEHLTGIKVEIEAPPAQPARAYGEIVALIQGASLSPAVQDRSLTMFRLLALDLQASLRILSPAMETDDGTDN